MKSPRPLPGIAASRSVAASLVILMSLAGAIGAPAQAASSGLLITEPTRTFNVGLDLADLQDPPLRFEQIVTDSSIARLTDVRVDLHLTGRDTGGYAGDMFVSVTRDLTVTSVLLNRPGSSVSNPAGASYDGWNVTFAGSAASGDIHTQWPVAGTLTGLFQPDGRIDPLGSDRSASLDVFAGMAANGAWHLHVADLDLGGLMRLESWGLTFTGESVPEPADWTLISALALATFVWIRGSRERGGQVVMGGEGHHRRRTTQGRVGGPFAAGPKDLRAESPGSVSSGAEAVSARASW